MTTTAVRTQHPSPDLMTSPHSIDRLYEQFFGFSARSHENGTPTYALPIDILEAEDAYHLYATVAGVPDDAAEVTFENGMLCVAVRATPFETEGKFVRQERPWCNWSRKLELPKDVDPSAIVAERTNGVLHVRVPKTAKAQPMRIAIGATDSPTAS